MTKNYDRFVEAAPDPQVAATRLDRLCETPGVEKRVNRLNEVLQKDLINIISISNFLFHFIIRHPDAIGLIGMPPRQHDQELDIKDVEALRLYKYRELLKIAWMDMSGVCEYRGVLSALSKPWGSLAPMN